MERGKRKNVMQNFVRLSIVHLQFSQCAHFFFHAMPNFFNRFCIACNVPFLCALFFLLSVVVVVVDHSRIGVVRLFASSCVCELLLLLLLLLLFGVFLSLTPIHLSFMPIFRICVHRVHIFASISDQEFPYQVSVCM